MNSRRTAIVVMLIVAACALIYSRVVHFDFINYDDNAYIAGNQWVRGGFTRASIAWAFTSIDYFYWQPITWLSHMADCQIFGLRPGWHHVVNVLFHIANSILLFAVFRRMTGAFWRSAFLAMLWAVHPLRVESVAWIAERKDVLSTFFLLATLWAYVRYVEWPLRPRYWLVLAALALGLLSKPMLITAPILLLLVDHWPLKRFAPAEKVPMAVMAALCLLVTYIGTARFGSVNWGGRVPLAHRMANALISYVRYLELSFWPNHLALLYPYRIEISRWEIVAAALVLAGITWAAYRLRHTRPYLAVGWLWFAIAMLPPSGLVQSGRQAMADRFTYIPSIGLGVMIVWGVADLLRKRERIAAVVGVAAMIACGVVAWRQVGFWRNSVTIFTRTVEVTEENPAAQHFLAAALEERGRYDEALPHHAEAVRIDPSYFVGQCSYGLALERRGDFAPAIEHFREAARYFPYYGEAYFHMGADLLLLGRQAEGAAELKRAHDLGFPR